MAKKNLTLELIAKWRKDKPKNQVIVGMVDNFGGFCAGNIFYNYGGCAKKEMIDELKRAIGICIGGAGRMLVFATLTEDNIFGAVAELIKEYNGIELTTSPNVYNFNSGSEVTVAVLTLTYDAEEFGADYDIDGDYLNEEREYGEDYE